MKKLLASVLIIILFISCMKKTNNEVIYRDGKYCADIHYYNPKTKNRATYTLPIELKDGKILEILMDDESKLIEGQDFDETKIKNDGTALFTSHKGQVYGILILGNKECNDYDVYSNN